MYNWVNRHIGYPLGLAVAYVWIRVHPRSYWKFYYSHKDKGKGKA